MNELLCLPLLISLIHLHFSQSNPLPNPFLLLSLFFVFNLLYSFYLVPIVSAKSFILSDAEDCILWKFFEQVSLKCDTLLRHLSIQIIQLTTSLYFFYCEQQNVSLRITTWTEMLFWNLEPNVEFISVWWLTSWYKILIRQLNYFAAWNSVGFTHYFTLHNVWLYIQAAALQS